MSHFTRYAFVLIAFSNFSCMSPNLVTGERDALTGATDGSANRTPAGTPTAVPVGSIAAFGTVATQTPLHLGTTRMVSVMLKSASDFSGMVNLSVDHSSIDAVDTRSKVTYNVSPPSVSLTANQTVTVNVAITADTLAPTIAANSKVQLKATPVVATSGSAAVADIPLQVDAIYDVDVLARNGTTDTWDGSAAGQTVKFAAHTGGVKIVFHNLDSASNHIVHGNGLIAHQNTGQPMLPATGGVENPTQGTYTQTVTSTSTTATGQYYCHSHEAPSEARTFMFNQ